MNDYGLRKIYKRNYMFYIARIVQWYTEYGVQCGSDIFDRILVYYMSYLMTNANARQKLYLWRDAWTCSSDNEAL